MRFYVYYILIKKVSVFDIGLELETVNTDSSLEGFPYSRAVARGGAVPKRDFLKDGTDNSMLIC